MKFGLLVTMWELRADGSTPSFLNFASGEPNSFWGNEDYVEMNTATGQWNDVPNIHAASRNYGVAEIVLPVANSEVVRGPGGCGGYVLLTESSFYPALLAAERMGGHLLTVTSAEENEFIRSTFADVGPNGRRLWLNASDRDDEAHFSWLTGEAFVYENFADSEPNNFNDNKDYITMVPSG